MGDHVVVLEDAVHGVTALEPVANSEEVDGPSGNLAI